MNDIAQIIAAEIGKPVKAVENVIALLDEGCTIPFIARYRKEAHGAMDDTSLRALEDRLKYLRNLATRKEEIIKSIEEQGKLTDELKAEIENAKTLAEAEDLYRPYKQKRRTRATIAKEKGLEPQSHRDDPLYPLPCGPHQRPARHAADHGQRGPERSPLHGGPQRP